MNQRNKQTRRYKNSNNGGRLWKLAEKYLYPKDLLNVVVWVAVAWFSTGLLTYLFGIDNAPGMSMGYIIKVLNGISSFAMILFASWLMLKLMFPSISDYFDDPDGRGQGVTSEFVNDMKFIRSNNKAPLKCYARPLFFLAVYFLFVVIVVLTLSTQY